MRFLSMGPAEYPVILFIPGLSCTAESCYGEVWRLLQKDWQVVLCELDGHYDESELFSSIDHACEQIEAYVSDNCKGKLHGMVGLSLGGTIAISILRRRMIEIEKTVLDAAFCVDMGMFRGLYSWAFPLAVARIRDGKYMPGFVIDLFMGKGNRSMVDMLYSGITVESCRNACRDVYSYRIPDALKKTTSKVMFWESQGFTLREDLNYRNKALTEMIRIDPDYLK